MERKKTEQVDVLQLTGALTVKRAGSLREELLDLFKAGNGVAVDLGEVTEIDLACLQILCSAHRYAVNRNKTLTVVDPGGLGQAAGKKAGFLSSRECRFNGKHDCLWKEEGRVE